MRYIPNAYHDPEKVKMIENVAKNISQIRVFSLAFPIFVENFCSEIEKKKISLKSVH